MPLNAIAAPQHVNDKTLRTTEGRKAMAADDQQWQRNWRELVQQERSGTREPERQEPQHQEPQRQERGHVATDSGAPTDRPTELRKES